MLYSVVALLLGLILGALGLYFFSSKSVVEKEKALSAMQLENGHLQEKVLALENDLRTERAELKAKQELSARQENEIKNLNENLQKSKNMQRKHVRYD